MSWTYRFDERALKELRKLDRNTQKSILAYLDQRIVGKEDPKRFGKALRAELTGLWRYRIGDYRVLCHIQDQNLIVLVLSVGHRKNIYL